MPPYYCDSNIGVFQRSTGDGGIISETILSQFNIYCYPHYYGLHRRRYHNRSG